MSITELQAERAKVGLDPIMGGRSLADRAGDEDTEGIQEELFILEQGRRVTVGQLVARGTPVEYRVNLNSKSIKGGNDMGLLPYANPEITLVVPARQGKVVHNPSYDEEGVVQKVVVQVNFRPLTVHDVSSAEGQALLGQSQA